MLNDQGWREFVEKTMKIIENSKHVNKAKSFFPFYSYSGSFEGHDNWAVWLFGADSANVNSLFIMMRNVK